MRQLHRSLGEFVVRRYAAHQADPLGLVGVDDVSGVHKLHSLRHPDRHGQKLRAAVVRRERALGEYGRKLGALRGDPDVAGQSQSESGADRGTVDRRDRRPGELAQQQRRVSEGHIAFEQRLVA